jgi:hypothetical protein
LTEITHRADPVPLFLHIPKTAGTTLTQCIYQQYRTDQYRKEEGGFFVQGIYYFPADLHEDRETVISPHAARALGRGDLRAVVGHFSFGIHQYVNKPWTYVTLLRNPVDRIVSLYHHFLTWENTKLHAEIVSNNVSIQDFVLNLQCRRMDNDQTRRISGLEPKLGSRSTQILNKAKENLRQHFSVVGVTERFYETLILLKRTFSWAPISYFIPGLVNTSRPPASLLPQSTIDTILEQNELDLQLYEFAIKMLDKLISSQEQGFYDEVEAFATSNETHIAQNVLRS